MMLTSAKKYHAAGISVIPIGKDKIPALADGTQYSWKKNISALLPPDMTCRDAWGIGIVSGRVSGNLECIDIDTKYDLTGKLFEDFRNMISDNCKGLLKKLVFQKTPSGGYHFLYRCKVIGGNQKIANRATTEEERKKTYDRAIEKKKTPAEAQKASDNDKVRVLIETRGEGGYFGVAPTEGYEILYGSIENINEITPEERDIIFSCARTFNEIYEPAKVERKQEKVYSSNKSPFEDFNENADIREILEGEGWTLHHSKGAKFYYLRPGGEQQWSGEYDDNKKLFYVWTTSSEFESEKAYNAAQVYSILKHKGDYSAAAKHLISEGYGEKASQERKETVSRETAKSTISVEDDEDWSFLADEDEVDKYLQSWRNGTFQMGLTTGWPSLDKYFLFKNGNFNIFNGIDNVGKSTSMWFLLMLSAMFHDWKWIIVSIENRNGAVTKKLIEFYWGIQIKSQTDEQYQEAKKFVADHFTIIKNEQLYNFMDVMNIADKCNKKRKHNGMLIDPYNGLTISLSENSKLSTHEYHYEGASRMQQFTKKRDMCIYLNCHVVTAALRDTTKAPGKGDTEGGGKFANKADDFGTFHRHTNDPDRWNFTEFHLRKIKELETGGGYTPYDKPFIMEMIPGGCAFKDVDGVNPVAEWHKKRGITVIGAPAALQPNTEFTEKTVFVRDFTESNKGDDLPF